MQAAPRRITPYSPFAPCKGERRNYLASTNYPTSVPTRTQTSPGVWSDGKDRVFSSAYPAVQLLLQEARATLKQPTSPNDIIFSLAALDVFYKPADPAHWIFWSDEKKLQTAEVVSRIARKLLLSLLKPRCETSSPIVTAVRQPPLIRTSVAWNGTSEYLYILANQHGSSYRHAYEDQPWFRRLVPQKSSAAPKVLNLRKRKQNPGAFREPSKSPVPEDEDTVEEPPRKRSKPKPAKSPEPSTSTGKVASDTTENPSVDKAPKSASASTTPKDNSHENTSQQPGTSDQEGMPVGEVAPTRMSTRNRKAVPSQTPSSSSRASSVSPLDHSTGSSHSRNRSISHTSSQTALASNSSRRSASVLSAATAVDGRSSTAKGKQSTSDGGDQPQEAKETSEITQSDEEGMVTRGRASRTRVDFSKIISETDSDRARNGKQTSNSARYGSQKAKRKL